MESWERPRRIPGFANRRDTESDESKDEVGGEPWCLRGFLFLRFRRAAGMFRARSDLRRAQWWAALGSGLQSWLWARIFLGWAERVRPFMIDSLQASIVSPFAGRCSLLSWIGGQVNSADPEDLADFTKVREIRGPWNEFLQKSAKSEVRGMNFSKSPRNPRSTEWILAKVRETLGPRNEF